MNEVKTRSFWQFIKFGLVGCFNTVLSYIVYALCVKLNIHYLIANIVGFVVGVLNAYYWSNKYVFKTEEGKKRNHLFAISKTVVSYGITGVLLQSAMLYLLVEQVGIDSLIAQLICLLFTVPLNFVLNKFWSFK